MCPEGKHAAQVVDKQLWVNTQLDFLKDGIVKIFLPTLLQMTVPQDTQSWAVAVCPFLGKDKKGKSFISTEKASFAQCSHTL